MQTQNTIIQIIKFIFPKCLSNGVPCRCQGVCFFGGEEAAEQCGGECVSDSLHIISSIHMYQLLLLEQYSFFFPRLFLVFMFEDMVTFRAYKGVAP